MDTDEKNELDHEADLKQALEQAEENLHSWQRAVADFENYKRRDEEEHKYLVDFAENRIIMQFLEIVEDLDRVLNHMPIDAKNLDEWKKGLEGVRKRLHDILENLGVKKIETLGEKFNPEIHEAVQQVQGQDEGIIAEEISSGYKRGDKLLKIPRVAVYKLPNKE